MVIDFKVVVFFLATTVGCLPASSIAFAEYQVPEPVLARRSPIPKTRNIPSRIAREFDTTWLNLQIFNGIVRKTVLVKTTRSDTLNEWQRLYLESPRSHFAETNAIPDLAGLLVYSRLVSSTQQILTLNRIMTGWYPNSHTLSKVKHESR
jgi:hypothetical protein